MRKGRDGEKKKREKKRKKNGKKKEKADENSGHYVIVSSRPPEDYIRLKWGKGGTPKYLFEAERQMRMGKISRLTV